VVKLPRVYARYLATILSLVAAFSLTWSARSLFENAFYSLFLVAVMLSSWYGGLTPGLIAVLFSVLALDIYFAPPQLSRILTPDDFIHLGTFLLAAGLINHLNRARMTTEAALRESHAQLQIRVAERTADLERLSGQLLQLQDEERRRTARMLHETVAQGLAALKMDLAVVRLSRKTNGSGPDTALEEAIWLADRCIREVRTVSYLLHPPLLDETGLAAALQWYVAGFEQRSGIKTELYLPETIGRLPRQIETTVFRIIQECLTNIHRHSGSPTAHVGIRNTDETVTVEVSDQGRGMRAQKAGHKAGSTALFGVGIMGMQERVKQLGGRMEIESSDKGTTVQVILRARERPHEENPHFDS
jgi:signal transduction histidine kinase